MPRIKQNKTKYKLTDYKKWIKKKMVDYDLTQSDVARIINISQPQFSYKLNNGRFTLEEFIILSNYFDAQNDLQDLIIY